MSLGGGSLPNNKKSATSYGEGGGRALPIPPGRPFSGRTAGGGNRQGVYGNRYGTRFSMEHGQIDMRVYSIYGSGYPGVVPHGVSGLGFPYYFWPVVWSGTGNDSSAYLYDSSEVR